jgi:Fur family zinc uptake transcriptional regulator
MLAATDAPLGAYAVLEELSKVQGKAVGPTTAYRTLDFLVENGIALKIASRNAYARCDHLGHHHHGALLICSRCGRTHEVDSSDLDAVVLKMASAANFKLEGQSVEIQGLCESCAGVG